MSMENSTGLEKTNVYVALKYKECFHDSDKNKHCTEYKMFVGSYNNYCL